MKTKLKLIVLLGAVGCAGWLFAQEPQPPPPMPPGPPPPEDMDLLPPPPMPPGGPGAMPPSVAGMRPRAGLDFMRELKETLGKENPAEYARLMDLKEKDPAAFRREIQAIMGRRNLMGRRGSPETMAEEEKCFNLSRQFHEAKDPAEAAKIKGELATAVKAAFDKRLQFQRDRLNQMEQQINRIREQIKERETNRDKVCELRMEELTREPKLQWGDGEMPMPPTPPQAPMPPQPPAPEK